MHIHPRAQFIPEPCSDIPGPYFVTSRPCFVILELIGVTDVGNVLNTAQVVIAEPIAPKSLKIRLINAFVDFQVI